MSQWKSNGTEWIPMDREAWAEYCLAHPTEWKAKYPTPPAADQPHRATYIPDQVTGIGNLNDGGVEAAWQGKRRETLPPGVMARENQPQPPEPELVAVGAEVEPDLIRGAGGNGTSLGATIDPELVAAARGNGGTDSRTGKPLTEKQVAYYARGRGRPRKGT